MKNKGIQSFVIGTAAMVLVVLLVVQGTAALDVKISDGVETILRSGHEGVEFKLEKPRAQLTHEVKRLVSVEGLASDLQFYIKGLIELVPSADGVQPAGEVKKRERLAASKERLAASKERLGKLLADYRQKRTALSGITLLDTNGIAVISNSTQFPLAKKLPFEKFPGLATALKGSPVYWVDINNKKQFVTMMLAPVRMRNGVMVGLVMIEKIEALTLGTDSQDVFVLDATKVAYGKPPSAMVVPKTKTKLIFPIAQVKPSSRIVGVGQVGLSPLFIDPAHKDVQALEFSIPGNGILRGFVTVDPSLVYSDMGGIQYTLILLAVVLWLLNITLALSAAKNVLAPASAIADCIGATLQGTIVAPVDDSSFPQELARLNRLVAKLLDKKKGKFSSNLVSVSSGPAPSAAELYGEGAALTDFASMDFYSSSSAVNLDELAFGPVSAPAEIVGAGGATRPPIVGGLAPEVEPVLPASDSASSLSSGALGLESGPMALDLPAAFTSPQASSIGEGSALADLLSSQGEISPIDTEAPKQSGAITNPAIVGTPKIEVLSEDFNDEKMAEWDDLGLEPLSDYSPPVEEAEAEAEAEESVPLGGSTQSSFDYGATSVMKVSPELIAQMRDRDPEAYEEGDSTVEEIQEENDSELFAESDSSLSPQGLGTTSVDSFVPPSPSESGEDEQRVKESVSNAIPIIPPPPPPPPTPPPAPTPPAPLEPDVSAQTDDSFRVIYDEFMATRRNCGESTELSYEKFVARLGKSQEAVKAKHGCRDVRFQVYVKNGKAALKASPIR